MRIKMSELRNLIYECVEEVMYEHSEPLTEEDLNEEYTLQEILEVLEEDGMLAESDEYDMISEEELYETYTLNELIEALNELEDEG